MTDKKNKEEKELDRYEKIVERAHKEIVGVHRVYKWLGLGLAVIMAAGGTIAWENIESLRSEVRYHATDMKNQLKEKVDMLEREVRRRVELEFDKESIRKLVQEEAKKRIDAVADELIGKQIEIKIDPKIKEINIEIENLKTKIAKFQEDFEVQKNLFDLFAREQDEKLKVTIAKVTKQREKIELATLPELLLSSHSIQKVEAGYEIKLDFNPSKYERLGTIIFEVQVVGASTAKILKCSRPGISVNVKHTIEKNGKKATFQYSPMISELQRIIIQVSGTCKLSIFGNYLSKPVNVVVE